MKIEVKNVKYSEFASQETLCMQCTLYVDGKRTALCSNDGQGGSTNIHPIDQSEETAMRLLQAEEFVSQLPDVVTDIELKDGQMLTYKQSLDSFVNDKVDEVLTARDCKRALKKVCVFFEGKVYTWPAKVKPEHLSDPNRTIRGFIIEKYPGGKILNELPFDEAFALYRKAVG